ncbi:MAG TPA: zinc-binding dehydrogenase [Vicinamibacterales bacterium]|nr:zinc-binding dehydrogenase [Vicinamibacterales bacterium]
MKAIRFHQHGGPDVLRYEDAPDPVSAPDRAIVRVRACALNHLDLWQRRGLERVRIPLPHISGADVAGDVVDAGRGDVPAGTRVMLQPGVSCGRCASCAAGRDNLCADYDVLGYMCDGGYAELVSVPVENLIRIPDHIDFATAAAFPLTFLTAWHMLVTRGALQPGETVLVLAAGSGVGQAAIQVARAHGARVFATVGPGKLDQARALGVDDVFDHYAEHFGQRVRDLTGGRGVDVVIEHVGEATWDRSVRALARGGRLVTCGATTGPRASIDLRHLFARQLSLMGSYMGGKPELLRATALLSAGVFTPVVDQVLPLSEARAAHDRLEAGAQFGKIVLEP